MIEVRTVSDSKGNTTDVEAKTKYGVMHQRVYIPPRKIVGTICMKDRYTFYIQKLNDKESQQVKMVLPIGGAISGLYRFPRVGEKVLVDKAENKEAGGVGGSGDGSYYLLGYVPNETDNSFLPERCTDTSIKGFEDKIAELRDKDEGIPKLEKDVEDLKERDKTLKKDLTGLKAGRFFSPFVGTNDEKIEAKEKEIEANKKLWDDKEKELADKKSDLDKNEKELQNARENIDKLERDQGMILRYRQTGKKPSAVELGEEYSEIGFYHKKTEWKPAEPADYGEFGTKNDGTATEFPKIDQINIQSTGDIHSKAENHHQTHAKRFELLVDCDPVDHTTYEKQPFGDRPGDDPVLYAGDAHIRAKNRVIIKAGEEIRLEVGRSSIIINDSGIILASRKIDSNIQNSWDTIINLNHRSGLTMFGQHVKIDSGMDFAITEGFGGSISSSLGVMRFSGKDILAKAYGTFNYIMLGSMVGFEMAGNIASMASGIAGADNSMGAVNSIGANVRALTGGVGGFLGDRMAARYSNGIDNIGIFGNFIGIIFSLLKIVWMVIEIEIPKEKQKKHGLDGLSMAAAVAEYGVAVGVFATIAAKNMPSAIHSSTLQLGADAHLTILTKNLDMISLKSISGNGPIAGIDDGGFKDTLKGGFKDFWKNTVPGWQVLVGLGIAGTIVGGGSGAGVGVGFLKGASAQDEKYTQELMAL